MSFAFFLFFNLGSLSAFCKDDYNPSVNPESALDFSQGHSPKVDWISALMASSRFQVFGGRDDDPHRRTAIHHCFDDDQPFVQGLEMLTGVNDEVATHARLGDPDAAAQHLDLPMAQARLQPIDLTGLQGNGLGGLGGASSAGTGGQDPGKIET